MKSREGETFSEERERERDGDLVKGEKRETFSEEREREGGREREI